MSTLSGFAERAVDAPKNPPFSGPAGLAVDGAGNVFVADMSAHRIQRVSPDGFVTTVAGAGLYRDGWDDGITARFSRPQGIAVTPDGVLYVADTGNSLIRRGAAVSTASVTVDRAAIELGGAGVLAAAVPAAAAYRWEFNGFPIAGATGPVLAIDDMTPAKAGLYAVASGEGANENLTLPVVVGVASTAKVVGAGEEVGANIRHANGNIYDQVLLTGSAATITADLGQITRVSFLDLNNDIVQVEFAGAGSLTVQLEYADGPALPVKYNQSNVSYMRGSPNIVIAGADETTNVSVFSVGSVTAHNPALFKSGEIYDGVADLGFIAIHSMNGKFGGIRTANANFGRYNGGWTGIYAPGVTFHGPVYLGGLAATSEIRAALVTGSVGEVLMSGGEIAVTGEWPLLMSGVARLRYGAGITSHNQARAIGGKEGISFRFLDDVRPQVVIDGID